jgi:hypothetical protein
MIEKRITANIVSLYDDGTPVLMTLRDKLRRLKTTLFAKTRVHEGDITEKIVEVEKLLSKVIDYDYPNEHLRDFYAAYGRDVMEPGFCFLPENQQEEYKAAIAEAAKHRKKDLRKAMRIFADNVLEWAI